MLDCNSVHTPGYGHELSEEQPEKLIRAHGVSSTRLSWDRYFTLHSSPVVTSAMLPTNQLEHATINDTHHCYRCETLDSVFTRLDGSGHHLQEETVRHTRLHRRFVRSINPDNRRSTTAYLLLVGGAPISFGANTHILTAPLTVEAEPTAIRYGGKEAVYLSNLPLSCASHHSMQYQSTATELEHFTSLGIQRTRHGRSTTHHASCFFASYCSRKREDHHSSCGD